MSVRELTTSRRLRRGTQPGRHRRAASAVHAAACAALLASGIPPAAARGGTVVHDGTVGPAGAVSKVGGTFAIPASAGRQVGSNLFHSFSRFDLDSGETASFTGPPSVHNVLARVTGGTASNINGTIRCTIPDANFYLINPAGVIFGPDATLDVQGSFAVTTADVIKLSDGGRFDARMPADSVLTTAAPAAFGFLTASPRGVQVAGATLEVKAGKSLSIVAGGAAGDGQGIQIVGGKLATSGGGRINLVSVNSGGDVNLDASSVTSAPNVAGFSQLGDVGVIADSAMSAESLVDATGGGISVRAANLTVTDSRFVAINAVPGPIAAIDFALSGDLTATRSTIRAGSGPEAPPAAVGGSVNITAGGTVTLQGTPFDGGDDVPRIGIIGDVAGGAPGSKGGATVIRAAGIRLRGLVKISSDTTGAASSGDIILDTDSLEISGSLVSASTGGLGDAGAVTVPRGEIHINIGSITAIAGLFFEANTGRGGSIVLGAVRDGDGFRPQPLSILELRSASEGYSAITTLTGSSGRGGDITIFADRVILDGGTKNGAAFISSDSGGNGDAGRVSLGNAQHPVKDLRLANRASISSTVLGSGRGSDVVVFADRIVMDGLDTSFDSYSFQSISGGDAGSITLGSAVRPIGEMQLLNGATVLGSTFGGGRGARIAVFADRILITGASEFDTSGIKAETSGSGDAGSISVVSRVLRIDGRGKAASISSSAIEEVEVDLNTGNPLPDDQQVTTTGRGGDVTVSAGTLSLVAGGEIAAQTVGLGRGGSVSVKADTLTIDGTGVLGGRANLAGIRADAFIPQRGGANAGGDVSVQAGRLVAFNGGRISASADGSGLGGNVVIQAGDANLSGGAKIVASAVDGRSGNVQIKAGSLKLVDGGEVSAQTFGLGPGGGVSVAADVLSIDGKGLLGLGESVAGIRADAFAPQAGGANMGGDVSVQAGRLIAFNGGRISASAEGAGLGGGVTIQASDARLSQDASILASAVDGKAGSVQLTAGRLALDASRVASATTGRGNAGSVMVHSGAGGLHLVRGAEVSVQATGADGGDVMVTSSSGIDLSGSQITAASAGLGGNVTLIAHDSISVVGTTITAQAGGDGGRITIDPPTVVLQRSTINGLSGGQPVAVRIESSGFFLADSLILTNRPIDLPQTDISGGLTPLRVAIGDAGARLLPECGMTLGGRDVSSFILTGQGGAPPEPDGWLNLLELRPVPRQ